ncbi:MAG: hypothetical protein JO244_10710, partial [Solirubrobacterales bacterium]|nr:hypothetical protein [Solirubrobacterales bacterium]
MSILQRARGYLRKSLDEGQRRQITRFQAHRLRGLQHLVYRGVIGSNLKALALVNNSDKWGNHWYVQHYETHFARLRKRRLRVLEIGIGGYADPEAGGSSLRMWRTYFPNSWIYGIDIFDKHSHDERRIKTFQGSQVDEEFLNGVIESIGRPDIIIDDGSHRNDHVIRTFELRFPR